VSIQQVFGIGFSGASEHEKLVRTARELEAVVLTQLLGAMRRTVPEGGLFGDSLPDDVFRSLLDEELARTTAERSPFGLARAIVERMERGVEGRAPLTEGKSEASGSFRRIG
jgi:flagellar protein FlgJ